MATQMCTAGRVRFRVSSCSCFRPIVAWSNFVHHMSVKQRESKIKRQRST